MAGTELRDALLSLLLRKQADEAAAEAPAKSTDKKLEEEQIPVEAPKTDETVEDVGEAAVSPEKKLEEPPESEAAVQQETELTSPSEIPLPQGDHPTDEELKEEVVDERKLAQITDLLRVATKAVSDISQRLSEEEQPKSAEEKAKAEASKEAEASEQPETPEDEQAGYEAAQKAAELLEAAEAVDGLQKAAEVAETTMAIGALYGHRLCDYLDEQITKAAQEAAVEQAAQEAAGGDEELTDEEVQQLAQQLAQDAAQQAAAEAGMEAAPVAAPATVSKEELLAVLKALASGKQPETELERVVLELLREAGWAPQVEEEAPEAASEAAPAQQGTQTKEVPLEAEKLAAVKKSFEKNPRAALKALGEVLSKI